MHWPRIRGLCSVSWCLAEGQWNGDQRRPMGHKAREGLYSLFYSYSHVLWRLACENCLSQLSSEIIFRWFSSTWNNTKKANYSKNYCILEIFSTEKGSVLPIFSVYLVGLLYVIWLFVLSSSHVMWWHFIFSNLLYFCFYPDIWRECESHVLSVQRSNSIYGKKRVITLCIFLVPAHLGSPGQNPREL